jgi:isopentenyl-diphosphate Delta-isomerase
MADKDVTYVDENDEVVGSGSIAHALETGAIVRIVRVFIVNTAGKILLQQRASSLKWDQSAGGHVDEGEDYITAAERELFEEMGIQGVTLTVIGKLYTEDHFDAYVRRRFNTVYYGVHDGDVVIDNDEVADYRWVAPDELEAWMRESRGNFTEGFLVAYKKFGSLRNQ